METLRSRFTEARDPNEPPLVAYDFRLKEYARELPAVKQLLGSSRYLPWRVLLQCGQREAELVGGMQADTDELSVLCKCKQCFARARALPDKGSIPGEQWGRLMNLEAFYEHGMNETLSDDISRDDAVRLCLHYINVTQADTSDKLMLGAWIGKIFGQCVHPERILNKRLYVWWYGQRREGGKVGHWYRATVTGIESSSKLLQIKYDDPDQDSGQEVFIPRMVAVGLCFLHWGRTPPVHPPEDWKPETLPFPKDSTAKWPDVKDARKEQGAQQGARPEARTEKKAAVQRKAKSKTPQPAAAETKPGPASVNAAGPSRTGTKAARPVVPDPVVHDGLEKAGPAPESAAATTPASARKRGRKHAGEVAETDLSVEAATRHVSKQRTDSCGTGVPSAALGAATSLPRDNPACTSGRDGQTASVSTAPASAAATHSRQHDADTETQQQAGNGQGDRDHDASTHKEACNEQGRKEAGSLQKQRQEEGRRKQAACVVAVESSLGNSDPDRHRTGHLAALQESLPLRPPTGARLASGGASETNIASGTEAPALNDSPTADDIPSSVHSRPVQQHQHTRLSVTNKSLQIHPLGAAAPHLPSSSKRPLPLESAKLQQPMSSKRALPEEPEPMHQSNSLKRLHVEAAHVAFAPGGSDGAVRTTQLTSKQPDPSSTLSSRLQPSGILSSAAPVPPKTSCSAGSVAEAPQSLSGCSDGAGALGDSAGRKMQDSPSAPASPVIQPAPEEGVCPRTEDMTTASVQLLASNSDGHVSALEQHQREVSASAGSISKSAPQAVSLHEDSPPGLVDSDSLRPHATGADSAAEVVPATHGTDQQLPAALHFGPTDHQGDATVSDDAAQEAIQGDVDVLPDTGQSDDDNRQKVTMIVDFFVRTFPDMVPQLELLIQDGQFEAVMNRLRRYTQDDLDEAQACASQPDTEELPRAVELHQPDRPSSSVPGLSALHADEHKVEDSYEEAREQGVQALIAHLDVMLACNDDEAEPSLQPKPVWTQVLEALGLDSDASTVAAPAATPSLAHVLQALQHVMTLLKAPPVCISSAWRRARSSHIQAAVVFERLQHAARHRSVEWIARLLDELCQSSWSHSVKSLNAPG